MQTYTFISFHLNHHTHLHHSLQGVANSITDHIEIVSLFLPTRHFFHVIAVTETWLDDMVLSILSLDNYTFYRRYRNRNVGGVTLYIDNMMASNIISLSDSD